MKTVIWFLVITVMMLIGLYVEKCIMKMNDEPVPANTFEMFGDDGRSVEERVIGVYNEVLQRYPNSKELIHNTRRILDGSMTMDGLKQRLIDSDEYLRIVKVQSNSMTPELNKVISDRKLLKRIADVYFIENNKVVPQYMVLPLKDVFIKLDYSENSMRAMYKDPKYPYFEEDLKFIKGLDYKQLMNTFDSYFNANKLAEKGATLPPLPPSTQSEPEGVTMKTAKVQRTIYDSDTNSTALINGIMGATAASMTPRV